MPHRHRTLQEEVRWRPPKCDSHVPATLVPATLVPLAAVTEGRAGRTCPPAPPPPFGTCQAARGPVGPAETYCPSYFTNMPWGWFNSRFPLDVTPLGGHHPTSGRARPPRVRDERGVRVWVGLGTT